MALYSKLNNINKIIENQNANLTSFNISNTNKIRICN
jgi:hypothetical protein